MNSICNGHIGKKKIRIHGLGVLLVVHGGGNGWWSFREVRHCRTRHHNDFNVLKENEHISDILLLEGKMSGAT
jgi:hypothetical protein